MDWKDYEKEIHELFQDQYPDAEITHDTSLIGRYSKVERQIDVLIEDYAAGEHIRILVDAKFFSKKVDVKEVESFIGMLQDVDADKGLLITNKGYSQAAINRAYNDPARIELDILNFEELKKFQGPLGLTYSGKHGVMLPSPFGWIVDGERRATGIATLYQRGLTYEQALKSKEWMYVNIYSKDDNIKDLESLKDLHESDTLAIMPEAKISYSRIKKRAPFKTLLRTIEIDSYPTPEYTGFIEFEDFIFFCVLFSPEELREKNLKKLEQIIAKVVPFNVNTESVFKANLNSLQSRFENSKDIVEKAEILIGQAENLIGLEMYGDALLKFDQSISMLPTCYGALKGKMELFLLTKETEETLNSAINAFFDLAPTNPTICQDLLDLYADHQILEKAEDVLLRKAKEYEENIEAKGNMYFHLGTLYLSLDKYRAAIDYFSQAKELFSQVLEKEHQVFESIEEILTSIRKET